MPIAHDAVRAPGKIEVVQENASNENAPRRASLGWLDRFLTVWILLSMVIGILLGNFVPETGPALQKGKFVGVSVPIGQVPAFNVGFVLNCSSCGLVGDDVSHSLQSPLRNLTLHFPRPQLVEAAWDQHLCELGHWPALHGTCSFPEWAKVADRLSLALPGLFSPTRPSSA